METQPREWLRVIFGVVGGVFMTWMAPIGLRDPVLLRSNWAWEIFFVACSAGLFYIAWYEAKKPSSRLAITQLTPSPVVPPSARASPRYIPQDVRLAVWERDGGRCVQCGADKDLEFDHIVPLSKGGSTTPANLQIFCSECNRRKHADVA